MPATPPTPPRSFAEHYRRSRYAAFPQEHRTGGRAPVTMLQVRQGPHDFVDPPVGELVVCAALRTGMTFRWDIGDGWTPPERVVDRSLHLLPPDTEARLECSAPHDMLFLAVPRGLVEDHLEDSGAGLGEVVAGNTDYFHHPAMVRLLGAMWAELELGSPGARLALDGHLLTLLGLLLRRGGRRDAAERPLPGRELARVLERIEAGLAEPLPVGALAREAGCSRFRFSRAFKAATGLPPHRYVMGRRLERARAMLEEGDLPLASVAVRCGFASQSHMTDVFRRRLGVSPGAYRRLRRP